MPAKYFAKAKGRIPKVHCALCKHTNRIHGVVKGCLALGCECPLSEEVVIKWYSKVVS